MTEPIRFELLAGARDAHAYLQLQAVLGRFPQAPVDAATDWDSAVVVFRSVREHGTTVRSLLDCLIAAVAIRTGATLVHRDADFTEIAAVMPSLKTQSLL
jgi:predicted nucleic acid-binding protein